MKRMHFYNRVRFYLLIVFLFIPGVWPAMAQDGDPLPLPGTREYSRAFIETQQIIPPATADEQGFGMDLGRDGNVLVVGAPLHVDNGAAIVYTQNASGVWGSPIILTANDGAANDYFGQNVAMVGDMIMVGAPFSNAKGAVYVFRLYDDGNWVQIQKLQPTIPADSGFGSMISLDPAGDQMLIGSTKEGVGASVYRLQLGLWQFETMLEATGSAIGLSIQGNRALIGSSPQLGAGSVLVFEKNAGVWTQTNTIVPSDPIAGDFFGVRILEIDDQVLITGDIRTTGAVYVFREVGGVWTQQQKLTPGDGAVDDAFGTSYSVQSDTLVIGSAQDDNGLGSVYIFKWNGGAWVQYNKIPTIGGSFGSDVILYEGELLVSAPYLDDYAGKVYVYNDPALMLLTNGGFESNTAGWNIKNPTGDKVKCNKPEKSKVFAHTGNCAFMFKGSAGENVKIQQTITSGVNAGDTLTFSGYVNAKGQVRSKIKIIVKYTDPLIEKSKIKLSVKDVTNGVYIPLNTFETALMADVTAEISKIKVVVKNNSTSGKVFYDALSLTAR